MFQFVLGILLLVYLTSADIITTTKINYSDRLKLTCYALPHRTVYYDSSCYFVIPAEKDRNETDKRCNRALDGAKLTGDAPDFVWNSVFADKSEFLIDDDSAGKKKALCVYGNPRKNTDDYCLSASNVAKMKHQIRYVQKLRRPAFVGQTFTIKGRIPEAPYHWSINLHNTFAMLPGWNTPLHFSQRYDLGRARAMSVINGQWIDDQTLPLKAPKNTTFSIQIRCLQDRFQFLADGKEYGTYTYRHPLSSVTHFSINIDKLNDVLLEYVDVGDEQNPVPYNRVASCEDLQPRLSYWLPTPFVYELKHRIEIGQTIIVKGRALPTAYHWSMNLHSKAFSLDPSYDVPLHLSFRYDLQTLRILTQRAGGGWLPEEPYLLPILKGEQFDFRIVALEDRFQFFANYKELATYTYKVPLKDITHFSIIETNRMKDVQVEYVHLGEPYRPIPQERGVSRSELPLCHSVFLSGYLDDSMAEGWINLNKKDSEKDCAIHFNPRYSANKLYLNNFKGTQWGATQMEQMPFVKGALQNVTITNEPVGFKIYVNGKYFAYFKHRMSSLDITTIFFGGFRNVAITVERDATCYVGQDTCKRV